jgi:hypothetical protein
MADYTLKPSLLSPLMDAIAAYGDTQLDTLMEELDDIRLQVAAGRSILISVSPEAAR